MLSFLGRLLKREQPSFTTRLETAVVKRQQLLAESFQRQSKKLSGKSLYFLLAAFCLGFATAFIRIGIVAIKDNHPLVVADPGHVIEPQVMRSQKDSVNTPGQLKYVRSLKEYLDSLKTINKSIQIK